jgi:hydrogenase maturation protease
VDAAQMGSAPGSWQRLSLDDLSSEAVQPFLSLHEPGVVEGLNLGRALKTLPEEVILYCVEPECIDNGTGLSPVVEAALPELVEDIYQELWKKQE